MLLVDLGQTLFCQKLKGGATHHHIEIDLQSPEFRNNGITLPIEGVGGRLRNGWFLEAGPGAPKAMTLQ